MIKDIELEISSLLSAEVAPRGLCQHLCERFLSPANSPFKEKNYYLSALIHIGFYKEALSVLMNEMQNNSKEFPWKHFLFLLWKCNVTPSKKSLSAIFKGAKEQDRIEELSTIRAWESWDPRFKQIHLHIANKKKKEFQEKVDALSDRVHFYRSQRLYGDEQKLLKRLQLLCPQNQEIQKQLKEAEELWSLDVISNAPLHELTPKTNHTKPNQEPSQTTAPPLPLRDLLRPPEATDSQEMKDSALHLFEFITEKRRPSQNKDQLYNIALFFKVVDQPLLCVQTLEGIDNLAADWLRVEAHIDARQYILALDAISHIEKKYHDNPETSFASTYAKALTFKQLGQTAKAIELMEKIIRIKLYYRSAHEHLKDWKEL